MKWIAYFLAGLAGAIIGFVLLGFAISDAFAGQPVVVAVALALGLSLLLGSPILFWFVIPGRGLWRWLRSRR